MRFSGLLAEMLRRAHGLLVRYLNALAARTGVLVSEVA
jgi:hypothetical protein